MESTKNIKIREEVINKMSIMKTLHQPTALSPYKICCDLNQDLIMSAVINGQQADAYRLLIKDMENNKMFDTGNEQKIDYTTFTFNGAWSESLADMTRIDDTNTDIFYSGNWTTGIRQEDFGHSYHVSNTAGDYIQFVFTGNGIDVDYFALPNGAYYEIYIDDKLKKTGDVIGQSHIECIDIKDLTNSQHIIKVVIPKNADGSSNIGTFEFDGFTVYDNTKSNIPFMYANTVGSMGTSTFTGNCVECYFETSPDSGLADIKIDGTLMKTIDLYSMNNVQKTLMYSNYGLNNGTHTIEIDAKGTNNSPSMDYYVNLEYINIFNRTSMTPLLDGDEFTYTLPQNTITQRGNLKWQLWLWNSDNDYEYIQSYEMIFCNMSTPVITLNNGGIVTSKNITFTATYNQAEKVPIKKWNIQLFRQKYIVNCGKFGDKVTGATINCGEFGQETTSGGRHIDCGTW